MGRSIFKCSGKGGNWGISVDNIGLELFTGFEHVKDTIFKGVRGTQKWVLEIDGCPGRFKHSDVLNLVGTKGVSQVSCVIRRNIRTLGEKESRWYVIPMLGESVPDRGVIVKGNIRGLEWTMASSNRDGLDTVDVDKMVAADLVWLSGKIVKMDLGSRSKLESEDEVAETKDSSVGVKKAVVTAGKLASGGAGGSEMDIVVGEAGAMVKQDHWVSAETLKHTLAEMGAAMQTAREEDARKQREDMDKRFEKFQRNMNTLLMGLRGGGGDDTADK